jgi:hypothetical protein
VLSLGWRVGPWTATTMWPFLKIPKSMHWHLKIFTPRYRRRRGGVYSCRKVMRETKKWGGDLNGEPKSTASQFIRSILVQKY